MTTAILAADTWTTVPEYATAATWRGQHDAAVVLKDGTKILVAGGADAAAASLKQSAVYDLAQEKWLATALLGTARQLHALTLLPSGKVLVTGGTTSPSGAPLATAEVFDPANGTWKKTAHDMKVGRRSHSAVLLSNGLVLVAGGTGARPGGGHMALRSAELFNPADDTWATVEGGMTDARTGHIAVVLQDGKKVLVCGGSVPLGPGQDAALAFCEVYDTESGTWKPTGSMHHPRSGHSATALSATTVLVAGGHAPGAPGDGSFDPFARATAEVYDLAAGGGTWHDAAAMPAGRALHRAVPLGAGKVLVIGGVDNPDNTAGYRGALLFAAGAWTPFAGLIQGRYAFAAAAAGTKVLVAGGIARTGLAAATQPVELTATVERSGT